MGSNLRNKDIVYILKDGKNEELRYSLRSIEKNFPHREVWFYGGKPQDITPDHFVHIFQEGNNKWEKVRNTLKLVCQNDDITEDFWLFNDDFFIMKPIAKPKNYYDGTLKDRIAKIEGVIFGQISEYSKRLRHLVKTLEEAGFADPLNYAHHTPMLINRKKMLETLEKYPNEPMFRALYGNINQIGGEDMPDVKFYQKRQPYPIGSYASTADDSWNMEKIGEIIRDTFKTKSRFEE